jgi:glycosyltransferase involved in cell wall biosynthesis
MDVRTRVSDAPVGESARQRVLVLATWFPWPPDNGSRQRLWALLGGLSARYDVDLLVLVDDPVSSADVMAVRERCTRVELVTRRPFIPKSLRAVAAFFHPSPRSVVSTYTRHMRETVDRFVADGKPVAVVVSGIHVARYALHLTDVPCILDELEPAGLRAIAPDAPVTHTLRNALTWKKVSRYIQRVTGTFAATAVVSEPERAEVLELSPGAHVYVVPNGVDVVRNEPLDVAPRPGTLIYPGAPTFFFNLEAVRWFADDVLPIVRAARPDVCLRVTGRTDSLPRGALPEAPGIDYTGYLDDIRPTVASSWCTVVPLRRGGGTRLKVLESMALGTPVVSTSKGIEGLDLVVGEEVVVADTADEFAAAVVALLSDPGRRAALSEAGRRAVETRHDWRPIAQNFVDVVQSVTTRR